jgi:hypothetical protein
MGLAEVSTILWRERELLELLLFKLEEEQLVLTTGRTRWLTRATKEVEVVLGEIKRTELARATEVDSAAAALGLGPNPSLNKLADACPEPWAGMLREHRKAFLTLTAEITELAALSRELLASGQQASRETMLSLTGESPTYTPHGATASAVPRARLMDEVL